MAGEGEGAPQDIPKFRSVEPVEGRSEVQPGMRPADLIPHLQGRLDAEERKPKMRGADDPRLTNVNLLGRTTIPGKEGKSGITIAKFSDVDTGVRYEITKLDIEGEAASVLVLDEIHSEAARYDKGHEEKPHVVRDLTDVHGEILALEQHHRDRMADTIQKYGGTPDFVDRVRTGTAHPSNVKHHGGRFRLPERIKNLNESFKNLNWKKKFVAGALTGSLIAFGAGKAVEGDEAPAVPPSEPGIGAPAVPGQEGEDSAFDKKEAEVRADIDAFGKARAEQILTDLENPKAGAKPYEDGTGVVNKSTLLGPDLEMDTADDAQYPEDTPEMFARVDEQTGKLYVASTTAEKIGPGEDDYRFNHAFYIFESGGEADTDQDGKIGIPEMKNLLEHPDTRLLGAEFTHDSESGGPTQRYGILLGEDRIIDTHGFLARELVGNASLDTEPEMRSDFKVLNTEEELNRGERDFKEVSLIVGNTMSSGLR